MPAHDKRGVRMSAEPVLVGSELRTQYTNMAVTPEGYLRPWSGVGTTLHPPVLKSDGQVTWLPSEHTASKRASITEVEE